MDYLIDELLEKLEGMISDMEEHESVFHMALEHAQQLHEELTELREEDESDF